ncbi:MAG: hypothetical protein AAF533_19200 [Acidobacteriota bacterium]
MSALRSFLMLATVLIFAITILVVMEMGVNWPAVFFGDLVAMNWRSQFNADFLIHLVLLATWVSWREGHGVKGVVFGFLSIVMGGMFGFPYILWATYQAKGDPRAMLLGIHADRFGGATAAT